MTGSNSSFKYHLVVFGCQMNKSDAERVAAVFEHLNYSAVNDVNQANIVVVVACSVRQTAIERIWGLVRQYAQIKKTRPLQTVVTGCLLPEDKAKFAKLFDFVFDIKELASLEKFLSGGNAFCPDDYFAVLPAYGRPYTAYVPIMTGCNNFCSYCAVPYVRGGEQSRSVRDVLIEVKNLARRGCREVQLLGQNVNSYAPADNFSGGNPFRHKFAALLWEINRIEGLDRVSFVSAHPKDMHDEVIDALALPKMMNYLHLAMQSGDDTVLARMNRRYTIEDYARIVEKVRCVKPNIALGTDIIVGFPGETRVAFENTVQAYKRFDFDIAYLAQYSPRRGTAAATFNDDVPREEKKQRWRELQTLLEKNALVKNQQYIGRAVSVLIDNQGQGFVEGNSREMKRVRINKENFFAGDIVEARIKQAQEWLLFAD